MQTCPYMIAWGCQSPSFSGFLGTRNTLGVPTVSRHRGSLPDLTPIIDHAETWPLYGLLVFIPVLEFYLFCGALSYSS